MRITNPADFVEGFTFYYVHILGITPKGPNDKKYKKLCATISPYTVKQSTRHGNTMVKCSYGNDLSRTYANGLWTTRELDPKLYGHLTTECSLRDMNVTPNNYNFHAAFASLDEAISYSVQAINNPTLIPKLIRFGVDMMPKGMKVLNELVVISSGAGVGKSVFNTIEDDSDVEAPTGLFTIAKIGDRQ